MEEEEGGLKEGGWRTGTREKEDEALCRRSSGSSSAM